MSRDQPPIVVGFDGSEDSRRAAQWAAAVAAATPGSSLHLVHALVLPPIPFPSPGVAVDALLDQHELEARRLLDGAARAIAAKDLDIVTFLRRWLPAETILEYASERNAALIVVGQRGARSTRLLLGSVSGAIARAAELPTVVVRGARQTAPPQRVLLAVDGSAPSERAAVVARRWCPQARFVAVRARDGVQGSGEGAIRRALEAAGFDPQTLEVRLIDGPAAESLLDLCERESFDLVAAGRRGLSAWRELLLGGVSEKLVQLAPCPVLLAR